MSVAPSRPFKDAAYAHLAQIGRALSSPARLELLELLAQAPRAVEALADEIGQTVANTSHHLQALRRAQLVETRAEGQRRVYSLAGADVGGLVAQLQEVAGAHLAELEALKRSYFGERDTLEALDLDALLERLRADEVVLVDVRPAAEFEAGHLPGALSLPLDELEARLDTLPRGKAVVAYCRGPLCSFSAEAATRLRALGFDARRADVSVQQPLPLGASS